MVAMEAHRSHVCPAVPTPNELDFSPTHKYGRSDSDVERVDRCARPRQEMRQTRPRPAYLPWTSGFCARGCTATLTSRKCPTGPSSVSARLVWSSTSTLATPRLTRTWYLPRRTPRCSNISCVVVHGPDLAYRTFSRVPNEQMRTLARTLTRSLSAGGITNAADASGPSDRSNVSPVVRVCFHFAFSLS